MTQIILFLMSSCACASLSAMEKTPVPTPHAEIPLDIKTKYDEEKKRFEKYDLEHPEAKFLPQLRYDLKKESNIWGYLEELKFFANLLLAQHFMLQKAAEADYINTYFEHLKEEEIASLRNLGVEEFHAKSSAVYPPNQGVLNELVTHSSILLNATREFTPLELNTILRWNIDEHLDPWMKSMSLNRQIVHQAVIAKQLYPKEYGKFDEILQDITEKLENKTTKLAPIVQVNTKSIPELYNANEAARKRYEQYLTRGKQLQSTRDSITRDYNNAIRFRGRLYQHTQSWYQTLYKVIRAELANTIGQLIASNPSEIKKITAYASNMFENLLPSKSLPKELPTFKKLSETVALPSLDLEKKRVKAEFEAEQKAKLLLEQKKPKKIKEADDGSYILNTEDTDLNIIIHNPINNTTEVIFKTDKPFQEAASELPPINYTDWVKSWFTNPQKALETQGYTDPKNINKYTAEHLRWKPIALHRFSPLVDEYIKQWGTVTFTPSRRTKGKEDILVTIPGKIIYPAGSKPEEETGVFAFIIDSRTGHWYHRMFTAGTVASLIKDLFAKGYFSPEMTGYYDVFFPPLPSKK